MILKKSAPSVPPPLPNPGFLFVTLIWLTAEDTCGGTVRGGSGVVTSPGYPGNYGNQADCTWILLAEPGDTISVIFTDFQTEEKYDYLEVEGSEPPTIWWVTVWMFFFMLPFICVCAYTCVRVMFITSVRFVVDVMVPQRSVYHFHSALLQMWCDILHPFINGCCYAADMSHS